MEEIKRKKYRMSKKEYYEQWLIAAKSLVASGQLSSTEYISLLEEKIKEI